ncbi:MAG: DUF4410 domain-containing protein [Pseudomonadota bacterium]
MKKLLFASALALTVSACANSSLLVERPNSSAYRSDSANIVYDNSTVEVDEENLTYTQKEMEEAFFGGDEPLFTKGDGMTVRYRYLSFDEGSQTARYFAGPFAGGSKVVMEVDFVDPNGTVMSTVRGEGTVSGGFFGGSNKSGIQEAIEEVAEYAHTQFHN